MAAAHGAATRKRKWEAADDYVDDDDVSSRGEGGGDHGDARDRGQVTRGDGKVEDEEEDEDEEEEEETEAQRLERLAEEKTSVVFPGDVVLPEVRSKTRIGLGLTQVSKSVVSTRCGLLRSVDAGDVGLRMRVDTPMRRYVAQTGDLVVGTVVEKHSEAYTLDIGCAQLARLSSLAFEGATKRNRPNIPVGALVYARVSLADKDIEPELSCTSPLLKKDWVTGQSLFGELQGGLSVECSLSLARSLLREDSLVLQCLGKHVPFELAVGLNGRVWVNAATPVQAVVICNAILNSEHLAPSQVRAMVERLVDSTR